MLRVNPWETMDGNRFLVTYKYTLGDSHHLGYKFCDGKLSASVIIEDYKELLEDFTVIEIIEIKDHVKIK